MRIFPSVSVYCQTCFLCKMSFPILMLACTYYLSSMYKKWMYLVYLYITGGQIQKHWIDECRDVAETRWRQTECFLLSTQRHLFLACNISQQPHRERAR